MLIACSSTSSPKHIIYVRARKRERTSGAVPRETHPMFFFRKAWVTALPKQETRIFAAEETQLRKDAQRRLALRKGR